MAILSRCPAVVRRLVRRAALLAFALLPPAASAVEAESLEYAVKAAYLYKFAAYVDWPATAFAAPDSAITVCVAGADPFGPALDAAVHGQRIAGRAVAVRRQRTVDPAAGCHILYVGGSEPQRGQILAAVRGSQVLTVTDSRDGSGSSGIIDFVIRDNRVRFDIDEAAAARNGLGISAKLMNLALNRRPGRQP